MEQTFQCIVRVLWHGDGPRRDLVWVYGTLYSQCAVQKILPWASKKKKWFFGLADFHTSTNSKNGENVCLNIAKIPHLTEKAFPWFSHVYFPNDMFPRKDYNPTRSLEEFLCLKVNSSTTKHHTEIPIPPLKSPGWKWPDSVVKRGKSAKYWFKSKLKSYISLQSIFSLQS